MDNFYKQAITLGVKNEYRNKITHGSMVQRIYNIMKRYSSSYWVGTIEDYVTTGYHVHIYFEGPEILWVDFNKDWGLGYVKNREVYDTDGWIKYIKKTGCYWEQGIKRRRNVKITPIERLTGIRLPIFEEPDYMDDTDVSDDGNNLPFEDDDGNNLPFN